MQDFMFRNIKKQDAVPEPYELYRKERALESLNPKKELMRDMEYFRSMYPERVKTLQLVVEEICDDVDYQDSPLYDEYPDRIFMEQLFHKVLDKAPGILKEESTENADTAEERGVVETYEVTRIVTEDSVPHMPYGPENTLQAMSADRGTYRTWEMNEELLEAEQLHNHWGPPSSNHWGPPPPNPWNPPPPPRPWGPPGPPPSPGPCGPSASCPWNPPPPPRPWGPPGPPPPPPTNPWNPMDMDDIIRLLMFGEMQKRRCNGRNCR